MFELLSTIDGRMAIQGEITLIGRTLHNTALAEIGHRLALQYRPQTVAIQK